MWNSIIQGDICEVIKTIPDASVDIVLCDPPYNIGKDFGNKSDCQTMPAYLAWCETWITECLRVLKPQGTMYIYGFSEILAMVQTKLPLPLTNIRWLIWHYTNKTVPSAKFWQRSHESIITCWKGPKRPVFNRDDVREPYTETFLKNAAGKTRKATKGRFSKGTKETTYSAHKKGALPRDVIKISALAGGAGRKERVDHPTQKPLELCRKLLMASRNLPIETKTKDGSIKKESQETRVLIPFAGSGSECVAAKELGLTYMGVELNPKYVELCRARISDLDA
jgi:site-specific DNA-methyltransferase (adenine-specific)